MEDIMSQNTDTEYTNRPSRSGSSDVGNGIGQTAREAVSKLSGAAVQATEQAKQSASDAASTVTQQVKEMLDERVDSGATLVRHLANSGKRAAEDLDRNAPQLAGLMRGVVGSVENFADTMRDQSVDQLLRAASDFTRRKPALVFGLAALAGFFVFRTLKAAPPDVSMSRHSGTGRADGATSSHGL
jgi:ElaB/YqjD/DUF883 family membrane-anchored ribosome-binding protein